MVRLDQLETIVCRPALGKDTKEVMELSSHIWEGNDYIPQVWDEWLADPDGLLGVAELGGRVVGVFKLTKFDDQEWYMEGLRVHPEVQGRGIASHIHNYVVDTWRRMGGGIIRLTTGSYNVKVHRMCEQIGFKRIAEFIPYRTPVIHEEEDTFTSLSEHEAERALEFVMGSPVHALSSRLINLAWVYGNTRLRHIQEAITADHAWWWKGGEGFISIWEDEEDDRQEPGIQLLACPVNELQAILEDYRRLCGELGYESAGWVAPNQPEVISSLEKAGFQRSWDVSLYIYELAKQAEERKA
jgi:GNAT superfamily N-acetyltransferase